MFTRIARLRDLLTMRLPGVGRVRQTVVLQRKGMSGRVCSVTPYMLVSGKPRCLFGRYVPLLKYLYNTVSIVNRGYVAARSCIQRRPSLQQLHVTRVKCNMKHTNMHGVTEQTRPDMPFLCKTTVCQHPSRDRSGP